MNRDAFGGPYFREGMFSFYFSPIPKIERYAYEFESKFHSIFENEVNLTKVPDDAPPVIARFVLTSRTNRILEVSEVNTLFKVSFKDIGNDEAFELYKEKATNIFQVLMDFKKINIESFASSALFHYPLKDPGYSVSTAILGKFFKIKEPSNLQEISFAVVQKNENITAKNIVGSYQFRQVTFSPRERGFVPGQKQIIKVRVDEMNLAEQGLMNKIELRTDDVASDDPQVKKDLFEKTLMRSIEHINFAEEFIFGGKE